MVCCDLFFKLSKLLFNLKRSKVALHQRSSTLPNQFLLAILSLQNITGELQQSRLYKVIHFTAGVLLITFALLPYIQKACTLETYTVASNFFSFIFCFAVPLTLRSLRFSFPVLKTLHNHFLLLIVKLFPLLAVPIFQSLLSIR